MDLHALVGVTDHASVDATIMDCSGLLAACAEGAISWMLTQSAAAPLKHWIDATEPRGKALVMQIMFGRAPPADEEVLLDRLR